jgi:uncharacterized protein
MDDQRQRVLWEDTVPPGAYLTRVIPKGHTLRVTDVEGAGAASLLAYNNDQLSERFNAADTAKIQGTSFLATGMVLVSDLGRVLFSITSDSSVAGHETLSGGTSPQSVRERFGDGGSYQELRNGRHTNDRDNFIAGLGRHGLDRRDLVPTLNLFSCLTIQPDGSFALAESHKAGASVELRAEMNVLIAISATPHVLDPSPTWNPGPLHLAVYRSGPVDPTNDACRNRSEVARRAFESTDDYWGQLHGSEG